MSGDSGLPRKVLHSFAKSGLLRETKRVTPASLHLQAEQPMSKTKVLVVDDDPKIRLLLRRSFEAEGFGVDEAVDCSSALKALTKDAPSVITLDIQLETDNGIDVLRAIRERSDVPVLMVTGRDDIVDRVVGLELGADDYVTKPFHPREVIARVRSVLRRTQINSEPAETVSNPIIDSKQGTETSIKFDGMSARPDYFELIGRDGELIEITSGEFRLLLVFLRNAKRILSRDRIMDLLNGTEWTPLDRTVDNHVGRLRKLIEIKPSSPTLIKTVRGIGYLLTADVEIL